MEFCTVVIPPVTETMRFGTVVLLELKHVPIVCEFNERHVMYMFPALLTDAETHHKPFRLNVNLEFETVNEGAHVGDVVHADVGFPVPVNVYVKA